MFYSVVCDDNTKDTLFVPDSFLKNSILIKNELVFLSAGLKKQNVRIVLNKRLNINELEVSRNILEGLSIPPDLKYQVVFTKDGIRLGPVIGLLMAGHKDAVTKSRLKKLISYSLLYPEIQGLLYVFSADDIDFDNKTASGFYYNPDAEKNRFPWTEGIFPLPDSIFQRTIMPEEVRLRLKNITGNRMFNSSYFDKWEFWNKTSKYEQLRSHLPYTRILSSADDVDFMLEKYGSVYLKPVNGTLSRGLYKVIKEKEKYIFRGKSGNNLKSVSTLEDAAELLKRIKGDHRYLIQQALNPLMVDGRHMDFRVIMQKDYSKQWTCTGIIAFLGNPGDICSNWGYETTFEEVFSKLFNYSQEQIFKKRQEVISICGNMCRALDMEGDNFGDLGFDVVIDDSLKVWVLEANKRHYHTIPLWINDMQTFYAVKTNIIKYATALSGFNL